MNRAAVRPRLSALYVPASNVRVLQRARTLDCNVIIVDLEDGVSPDVKDAARVNAVEAIEAGGFGRKELVVRINGLDTPWGSADIAALARLSADAVLVPKLQVADDVRRYRAALDHAGSTVTMWAMIETARCLFHLHEIAAAGEDLRLSAFVMGTNDLSQELRSADTPGREPLWAALGLSVAAARAYGLEILDGVFNALEDEPGFVDQCRQGRDFGFDGKTLIHPRQIGPCNEIFSPSLQSIAWARSVVAAFALPENLSRGAIRLDGQMVERLHLSKAQRLLAIHAALNE